MIRIVSNYLSALAMAAATAAGNRSARRAKLPKGTPPKKAKLLPASIEARKELAFSAFPNHFGNYLGKRDPKPDPRPLTADERFARLAAEHECRARPYRWKRAPGN